MNLTWWTDSIKFVIMLKATNDWIPPIIFAVFLLLHDYLLTMKKYYRTKYSTLYAIIHYLFTFSSPRESFTSHLRIPLILKYSLQVNHNLIVYKLYLIKFNCLNKLRTNGTLFILLILLRSRACTKQNHLYLLKKALLFTVLLCML